MLEDDSQYAKTSLIIAPNVIVFERLRTDFAGGRIFRTDPIIPPELKIYWEMEFYIRGDSERASSLGALYLTNIHQLYEDKAPTDNNEPDIMTQMLGPLPPANLTQADRFDERIIQRGGPVFVANDEAHHTHDENNEWNKGIRRMHAALTSPLPAGTSPIASPPLAGTEGTSAIASLPLAGTEGTSAIASPPLAGTEGTSAIASPPLGGTEGTSAIASPPLGETSPITSPPLGGTEGGPTGVIQLDVSATPRYSKGSLFTWTVFDYPLKQAILDNIVKRPIKGITSGIKEVPSDIASIRYQSYLTAGVERWREYRQAFDHPKLKRKPVLFVMMNSTKEADDVADYLRSKYPGDFAGDKLLVIHTDRSGEVSKKMLKPPAPLPMILTWGPARSIALSAS